MEDKFWKITYSDVRTKLKVYSGNQQNLILQEFQTLNLIIGALFPAENKPQGKVVNTEAGMLQLMKIFGH